MDNVLKHALFPMQGWVTLQLTRDPGFGRGFFSPRSVTGFLSDVCSAAADEVGKIYLIADENVSFSLNMLIGSSSMQATMVLCIKSVFVCISTPLSVCLVFLWFRFSSLCL